MVFTVLSVISSLLEYCLQSYLLDSETLLIVKFSVVSSDIQSMSRIQFHKKIEMKRNGIESEISKLFKIDYNIIEELKPIQTKDGALFTIHMATDELKPSQVWQVLQSSVNDRYLPTAVKNIYKLEKTPSIENIETKEIVAAWEQRSGRKSIANFVIHSSNKKLTNPNIHHSYMNSSSFNNPQAPHTIEIVGDGDGLPGTNRPVFTNVASNSLQYVQTTEMQVTPGGVGGGTENPGSGMALPQTPQNTNDSVIPKTETIEEQYGMEGKGLTKGQSIYQ